MSFFNPRRLAATLAIALSCATFGSVAAQATAYSFSETFDNPSGAAGSPLTVTGTFEGTANGNLITGLSNFTLFFNGVEATDPSSFTIRSYDGSTYDLNAVVSFDGLQNNFLVGNSTDPGQLPPSVFLSSFTALGSSYSDAASDGTLSGNNSNPTSMILLVTEVPEPASFALLALGMTGLLATRRMTRD